MKDETKNNNLESVEEQCSEIKEDTQKALTQIQNISSKLSAEDSHSAKTFVENLQKEVDAIHADYLKNKKDNSLTIEEKFLNEKTAEEKLHFIQRTINAVRKLLKITSARFKSGFYSGYASFANQLTKIKIEYALHRQRHSTKLYNSTRHRYERFQKYLSRKIARNIPQTNMDEERGIKFRRNLQLYEEEAQSFEKEKLSLLLLIKQRESVKKELKNKLDSLMAPQKDPKDKANDITPSNTKREDITPKPSNDIEETNSSHQTNKEPRNDTTTRWIDSSEYVEMNIVDEIRDRVLALCDNFKWESVDPKTALAISKALYGNNVPHSIIKSYVEGGFDGDQLEEMFQAYELLPTVRWDNIITKETEPESIYLFSLLLPQMNAQDFLLIETLNADQLRLVYLAMKNGLDTERIKNAFLSDNPISIDDAIAIMDKEIANNIEQINNAHAVQAESSITKSENAIKETIPVENDNSQEKGLSFNELCEKAAIPSDDELMNSAKKHIKKMPNNSAIDFTIQDMPVFIQKDNRGYLHIQCVIDGEYKDIKEKDLFEYIKTDSNCLKDIKQQVSVALEYVEECL